MKPTENEIENAKRRVAQMNEQATRFSQEPETPPQADSGLLTGGEEKDRSTLLIFALILLLSNENADNKILLALLSLLL